MLMTISLLRCFVGPSVFRLRLCIALRNTANALLVRKIASIVPIGNSAIFDGRRLLYSTCLTRLAFGRPNVHASSANVL